MVRDYIVNGVIVLGLAVVVSLSWVGSPTIAGWSRFIGSVLFYAGIEMVLWLITHPLVQEYRSLSYEELRIRKRFPE